jgi:tubby and related proteins
MSSSMLRSRTAPPSAAVLRHAPSPTRKVSDEENQVTPFYLDDGTDDLEEIRRRRYSSSASSSSDSDAIRRQVSGRGGRGGPARRPHARSLHEKESEWEKASSGRAEEETSDSDSSGSLDKKAPSQHNGPESPRRTGRKKTQQSEAESDSESDTSSRKESAISATTTTTTATTSAPSTPRMLGASELAGLSKLAVYPGSEHQLIQAQVRRVKTLLHAQYHFIINDQLILMAEKEPKSRTPNYRLFDMTRSAAGLASRLTKKSGNYIGKVRSNFSKKKSVLIGHQSRKTELAAVLFRGNVSNSEPRQLTVVLPPLHTTRHEVDGIVVGDNPDLFSVLLEHYKALKKDKTPLHASQHLVQIFENKQPVFENGFYRLNFHGRVSVPSIKNFQLIHAQDAANQVPIVGKTAPPPIKTPIVREDGPPVYLQFGKVDDNKFHLDFRAPITPIQAFAIALAQFSL